jgi:ABC-2 type transport system ATP-binding protein
MELALKTEKLTKSYFAKKALRGVDIQIQEGQIVGLLGPNGSGKTTLMKIVAGILKPSGGSVEICGLTPGVGTKEIVSYLPDVNYLMKWMKIKDALNFFNDFYKDFNIMKAKEMLKFMNLSEDEKITSLSKGMAEKLYLTLTLSRKAKLYVLDEPLGGIDPIAREQIMDAIINNYREDCAMLISTHLVKDIERVFDRALFIADGSVILEGNAEELREQYNKSLDGIYREVFADV